MKYDDIRLFSKKILPQRIYGGIVRTYRHFKPVTFDEKRFRVQPNLTYFALNILDHCNLRCKGCNHFSSIAEKNITSVESISKDLKEMFHITNEDINRIGIMEGELLLHPSLAEVLESTRKIFSNIRINLVTNGLLF